MSFEKNCELSRSRTETMPLPRSIALRLLRRQALTTPRTHSRTLATETVTPTNPISDGTWKFVAGKRVFIAAGSIRMRMESKERKLLADRELATAPEPQIGVPSICSTATAESGLGEDVDEGIGMAGLDSSGEGAEPFTGYQRLQKGDLCELRYVVMSSGGEGVLMIGT